MTRAMTFLVVSSMRDREVPVFQESDLFCYMGGAKSLVFTISISQHSVAYNTP